MKKEKKNFVPLKICLRVRRKTGTTPLNGEEKERRKTHNRPACEAPSCEQLIF
jgi:hypothetical protein